MSYFVPYEMPFHHHKYSLEHGAQRQRVRLNSSSLQLELDVDLGTNEVKGQTGLM